MDYNLWQQLINSNIGQRATLPIQYLFGDRDKAEQFWNEDMGRFGDLLLSTTKPFRTGANILAQNWGSALTGKDMSQSENQGGFLKWLAGGITPEEQQVINDKPYLSALKSGAGMASTLAPFGTQGLRAAQFASNPLTNRLAQLASQGALEGGLGGFGYSREGKEVQDTLVGAGMGAGGELLMDYLTNPQFRKMITEASTYVDPNTGGRMYRGGLGDDVDLDVLRDRAYQAAQVPDQEIEALENMYKNMPNRNNFHTDIEALQRGNKAPEIAEYLQALRDRGLVDPGQVDMLLKFEYGIEPSNVIKMENPYLELTEISDYNNPDTKEFFNADLEDTKYPPVDIPDDIEITNYQDYDNPLAKLESEAKKYKTPEEFVKAQGTPVYHGTNEVFDNFDLTKSRFKGEQGENLWGFGTYTSPDIRTAKIYGKNILEIPFSPKKPLNLSNFKTTKELADYLDMSEDALIVRNGIPTAKGQQAAQLSSKAQVLGHDAIIAGQETVILDPSQIKTKSQLIDIWNKVHNLKDSTKELRGGFKDILEKASRDGIK